MEHGQEKKDNPSSGHISPFQGFGPIPQSLLNKTCSFPALSQAAWFEGQTGGGGLSITTQEGAGGTVQKPSPPGQTPL